MNSEEQAQQLHDADPWPDLHTPDGRTLKHQKWDGCNEEHKQRYRNLVEVRNAQAQ